MSNIWQRDGAARQRVTRIVKERGEPCYFCHELIDPRLKFPNPASFSVHHIIHISEDPRRAFDPTNCTAAHLSCNRIGAPSSRVTRNEIAATSRDW